MCRGYDGDIRRDLIWNIKDSLIIHVQLCDYLEEYHAFFTKGRDKLSELMPVIARYRNKIKEFFDEKSRVESDGESVEEDGEDKNGDVSLNDFLKVLANDTLTRATN